MKTFQIKKRTGIIRSHVLTVLLMLTGMVLFSCADEPESICMNRWWWLKKDTPPNTGPAPDYSDLFFWAASPHKWDLSDTIPDFLKEEERKERADVFFVHPTTYVGSVDRKWNDDSGWGFENNLSEIRKMAWNADLTDEQINLRTDERVLLNQASVFNGCCRIYAPRYRQASLKAFLTQDAESAQKAFDLAYSDIKTAFEYYLDHENAGRPVIIASHSQGTKHAIRLMQEYFDGRPLQSQLICAYLIGWNIPRNAFQTIPLCTSPESVGGFVGWRSYRKGKIPMLVEWENGDSQCINPLSWRDSGDEVCKKPENSVVINGERIETDDICTSVDVSVKILWVAFSGTEFGNSGELQNLHTFDYNLFWLEMRENSKQRVESWYMENPDR